MTDNFYALVPAAGSGSRMGLEFHKQYLMLAGKPMIWHAVSTLCTHPQITTVFVVLAADDRYWRQHNWNVFGDKLQPLYCGGGTRAESVMNGLLISELEPEDWVLVHDAARPCLTQQQVTLLLDALRNDEVGGLLAVPVADTLKRAGANQRVVKTEDRQGLWQAQTPQMFRAGLLSQALETAPNVTDEASAIEAMGLQPKLVNSDMHNFKVTYPQDMRLAEMLLQHERTT